MDQDRINQHVRWAQAHGQEISDACARMIGAAWHGSNDTASFSTTGAIVTDPSTLWHDFFSVRGVPDFYAQMSPEDRMAADSLGTYLHDAGERGPVDGWSGLWINHAEDFADMTAQLEDSEPELSE